MSARKEPEQRHLAAALKASEIGVFEFDPQTNIGYWDARVRELWGITSDEDVTIETVNGQIHPDDIDFHTENAARAYDPNGPRELDMEYRVLPRDGSPMRWIRAQAACTFDGNTPIRLLGTVQDITERRAYTERNTLLIGELQHRVKNMLATVISVIKLSKVGNDDIDDYATALEARMQSMAETHNALSKNDWHSVKIREIFKREFHTFAKPSHEPYTITGPDLEISADNVQIMSMAIHELVTNAIKHGSLSMQTGQVEILLRIENGLAGFTWREINGPALTHNEEPKGGFGSFLLTQVLRAELDADIIYELRDTGIVFEILYPIKPEGALQ